MAWIAALMMTVVVASTAVAATPAEKFKASVERKVAPPFGTVLQGKWKALCACNTNDRVGALETFNGIPALGITCTVPTFNAQGEFIGGSACYDWTPVTK